MKMTFFSAAQAVEAPELPVGCEGDDDCPDYTACQNTRCINPCAQGDPCAPNAQCSVYGHQVRCACPNGFIGDPTISCTRRES